MTLLPASRKEWTVDYDAQGHTYLFVARSGGVEVGRGRVYPPIKHGGLVSALEASGLFATMDDATAQYFRAWLAHYPRRPSTAADSRRSDGVASGIGIGLAARSLQPAPGAVAAQSQGQSVLARAVERLVPQIDPFAAEDAWIADGTDSTFMEWVAWYQAGCVGMPGTRWITGRPYVKEAGYKVTTGAADIRSVQQLAYPGLMGMVGGVLKGVGGFLPGVGPLVAAVMMVHLHSRRK